MKTYEIWAEGYAATGEYGKATYLGTERGKTFKNACDNKAKNDSNFAKYYEKQIYVDYVSGRLYSHERN